METSLPIPVRRPFATTCVGPRPRKIGVGSVLLFGLPTLAVTLFFTQFAVLVRTELRLLQAAEVGLRTAELPGATSAEILLAVRAALPHAAGTEPSERIRLTVNQRDPTSASTEPLAARPGDTLGLYLAVDALDVTPDLFGKMGLSLRGKQIRIYRTQTIK